MESTTIVQKEFRLQLAVVKHLDSAFAGKLEYLHIPNRGGDATDGYFKQLMGAKAGASDLLIGWREVNYIGAYTKAAFIELKAPGGAISSQQNKFLSRWNFVGFQTAVCKSVKEVHDRLMAWGIEPKHHICMEPDYTSKEEKQQIAHDFYAPTKK